MAQLRDIRNTRKAVLPTILYLLGQHRTVFLVSKNMNNKINYFAYLRKSTDSEDRQINSIGDQKREICRLAEQMGLTIKGFYEESRSAKQPGRPLFNKMLSEIKKGKANGILAWKLNRLARNPVDGGEIMWLVQQGILKSIQTPGREYKTGDNVIIMSVELGLANQFILDLSKDVKRGMQGKAERGWRPGRAPIGYKNDKAGERGKKEVLVNEEKFPLVRKMWDLMLTGDYSVTKIIDIANNEWGLRTTSKNQEIKLSDRHGYAIFNNTFYYGEFTFSGKVYQGKHPPMVTPDEFDYVQRLLGKKGRASYTRHKDLPYRGTMRCGECGCSITAEQKSKLIKSEGKVRTYIYHHCTNKKAGYHCSQKSTQFHSLNEQILEILEKITLPKSYLELALEILKRDNELEEVNKSALIKNQQKSLVSCQQRLDNLVKLYISTANVDKDLISDEELKSQKTEILKEKSQIQQELAKLEQKADEWLELTEKTFEFAVYAKQNFLSGNHEIKTGILRSLSSNSILKDGKLDITLRKQYQLIEESLKKIPDNNKRLEPIDFVSNKTKTATSKAVFAIMSG